jgi:oligoribonuclease NrnB/cAMP/cGMP phosphodiesterase (DHH superfamily)
MKPLCVYHANCADGFTSAWVVNKAFKGDVDFHPGVYQDPPPDVKGRDVLLVDFSYKSQVLAEMAMVANTITILDHHKTAAADLKPWERPDHVWSMDARQFRNFCDFEGSLPIRALFDMSRSGAGITWDYFNPGVQRPKLLDHIEDRDLWKFALPGTREIQAAIFSYAYDFKTWDWLIEDCDPAILKTEGIAIERKHFKDIKELVQVVTRPMRFRAPWMDGPAPADLGFVIVPMANLPYTLTSDAGHLLSKGSGTDILPEHPFAGCYFDTPEGRVFSLRSAQGGADVSAIAKQYGGGGHAHAAGFRIPWKDRAIIMAMEDGEQP